MRINKTPKRPTNLCMRPVPVCLFQVLCCLFTFVCVGPVCTHLFGHNRPQTVAARAHKTIFMIKPEQRTSSSQSAHIYIGTHMMHMNKKSIWRTWTNIFRATVSDCRPFRMFDAYPEPEREREIERSSKNSRRADNDFSPEFARVQA